jgi:SAM-dependent methyltransferase
VQADLGRGLPFRDGVFAGVLALLVVQHVPDTRGAVEELCRVAAPGVPVLVSVPAKEGWVGRRGGLYWWVRALGARVPGLIHWFRDNDVRALVSGFEIVELRRIGGAHAVLLRNPEAL